MPGNTKSTCCAARAGESLPSAADGVGHPYRCGLRRGIPRSVRCDARPEQHQRFRQHPIRSLRRDCCAGAAVFLSFFAANAVGGLQDQLSSGRLIA